MGGPQETALIRPAERASRDHSVKTVFLEGLTEADLEKYRKVAASLASWKEPEESDPNREFLRQQHRKHLLALGATARVEGLDVLPAEDSEILELMRPGKVTNQGKEFREDAILLTAMASEERVVVIIMGGVHDLSDNFERIVADGVELVRLQVEAHYKAETENPGY